MRLTIEEPLVILIFRVALECLKVEVPLPMSSLIPKLLASELVIFGSIDWYDRENSKLVLSEFSRLVKAEIISWESWSGSTVIPFLAVWNSKTLLFSNLKIASIGSCLKLWAVFWEYEAILSFWKPLSKSTQEIRVWSLIVTRSDGVIKTIDLPIIFWVREIVWLIWFSSGIEPI